MPRLTHYLVAAVLAATPAAAQTLTLDCKMTDLKRSGGWIPRAALLQVDTARKTVRMIRPTPDQLNGRVTSSKLVRNDTNKMVLRWVVKGTRSSSNQSTTAFNFRAIVSKSDGKIGVIAKPIGYANDFRGNGTCKIS